VRTRRSSSSAAHPAARRHRLPWTPRPPFGSATPRLRVSGRSGGAEKIQNPASIYYSTLYLIIMY
jgi:hypothetical protein